MASREGNVKVSDDDPPDEIEAIKQDVGLTPGSDQKCTQSDQTICSAPITGGLPPMSPPKNTDEVDGRGSDNPSMSVTMSDELTLDDGNDSDGNVTDSSTDSETTLGRGIDVIVHYKNKLRKQLQEFKKPLYIPLTLGKYLKWQYITNNRSLLQQRMAELAKITENVRISNGILEVFLRRQKEEYDFDSLAKTLEETLLSDTDSIAVSWFPLKASHPGTEFLQVLNRVVQHSDIGNELYTEMTDTLNSKVIRFVHDVKFLDKAKDITNQAVHEIEKKILSEWHTININLPIVYSHIFEKYEMKRRVRTVSSTVLVFFNIIESKDEFNIELRGQQQDLNRVRKWIEEVFINPYCCLELGFGEVQMCEESIDIPSIIMNTLEGRNYQHLFWTINNHSKKTWICSSKSDDVHEAIQVVKTCVKQTKESKKTTKSVEEIESIVEEFVAVYKDILGRSVSVRVLTEDEKDLAIYLRGEEHQIDSINNWFDSYTRSTTGMETYAATKQDADLTPESDQKQTQSDPTIGSTLITGPYQASSPIIPATEKAIVEDHLPGLPPKLPPKYTGSPMRDTPFVCGVDIRQTDDTEYLQQPEAHKKLKIQVQTYELHIGVKFQRINGKEFTSDVSLKCDHEQYMKWHYVLGNPSLFKKRRQQLIRINIPNVYVVIEEGETWLVINIGTVAQKVTEAEQCSLRDKVIEKMLLEMDVFEINSFLTTGIVDKTQAVELMMEKSAKEIGNELWLYAGDDSDYIHYIYPKTRVKDVERIIKSLIGMLHIGEQRIELDLVFSKVFEKFKVKHEVKKAYEARVILDIDCSESNDKCKVILRGRETDVELAVGLITTKYVEKFVVNKLGFNDLRKRERSHNVEQIVREVLCDSEFEDVFWHVNDTSEKISVCSESTRRNDEMSNALKNSLKRKTFMLEHQQLMLDSGVFKSGMAVMKIMENRIEVIGTEKALMCIEEQANDLTKNKEVHDFDILDERNERTEESNHNAADDNPERREKQNQDITVKSKGAFAKEFIQKTSMVVDELGIFDMLHGSSKFQNYAQLNHVTLEEIKGKKLALMLTGRPSNCIKVKEMISQLTTEFKQKQLATKTKSSKLEKNHWDLRAGHCITVQASTESVYDIAVTVLVDTVQPEEAKFDVPNKLHLPHSMGGTHKEKEKIKESLKDLLMFCSAQAFFKIKLKITDVHKTILKLLIIGMFEVLSENLLFASSTPLMLIICTDSDAIYTDINRSCKRCSEWYSTPTCQPQGPLNPPLIEDAGASSSGTYEDDVSETSINIEIIIGQLNGTKADAIVNTTGTDLNLNNGNVSKALLKSAGYELQMEVNFKRPHGIKHWDIFETYPHKLQGCNFVLHGALDKSSMKNIKRLLEFVFDCLAKAEDLKCRSIAFPALGTGNLGYPRQEVAQTMFEAVRKFGDRGQFLKEVKFVLYHLDTETIKAFQTEEKLHVKHFENRIKMEQELSYIGHIGTNVMYGELKDITTSGIIYIWEKKTLYRVKIKDHHLLKRTDKDVQQEWTSHRDNPSTRGLPLSTTGGDLPVACIIHVFSEDGVNSMRKALFEGLQMASGVDSVSVFFSNTSSFLRFGKYLVDAFVQCVKDVQKNETNLRNVVMITAHMKSSQDFLAHLHNNPMVLRGRPQTRGKRPPLKL